MADLKLQELTEATAITGGTLVMGVNDPDGTPADVAVPVSLLSEYKAPFNVVVDGDSLSNTDAGLDWPALLMEMSQFDGAATLTNLATSGQALSHVVARYTSTVAAMAPNTTGVPGWYFVWVGANDIVGQPDVAALNTAMDSLLTTARADGWKICLFTLLLMTSETYATEYTEPARLEINEHRRKSTLWDVLVEVDRLFPDQSDFYRWGGDEVHITNAANRELAVYLNNVFGGPGGLTMPGASPVVVGTSDGALPTNAILKANAREYTQAQTFALATLTDAATIAWDLDDAQVAQVTLEGSRTMGAPSNQRAGGIYNLIVNTGEGSFTLAWPSVFKFDTTPTLSAGANKADVFEFVSNGTYMLCRSIKQNLDVYVEPALVFHEAFAPTGSNQNMNGTVPDTIDNTGGSTWQVLSGTTTRTTATGRGSIGAGVTMIETGLTDGVMEGRIYSGSGGVICRLTDVNNYVFLILNMSNGSLVLYKRVAGTPTSLYLTTVTQDTTNGNLLRLEYTLNTFRVYVDGVLLSTVVDAFNNTATKVGMYASGGTAVMDDVKMYEE